MLAPPIRFLLAGSKKQGRFALFLLSSLFFFFRSSFAYSVLVTNCRLFFLFFFEMFLPSMFPFLFFFLLSQSVVAAVMFSHVS